MEEIQWAQANEPPPPACPPTKLFVPAPLHLRVMQWVHEAPSSGHPGIQHTAALNQFWRPALTQNVEEYMGTYSTCAQSQTTRQLPMGLLEPGYRLCHRPPQLCRSLKSFLHPTRVNVSLSSGYHLQSNGQTKSLIQEIGRRTFRRACRGRLGPPEPGGLGKDFHGPGAIHIIEHLEGSPLSMPGPRGYKGIKGEALSLSLP
ncbi:hypothetical protein QTP86_008733 [Hemibagrus guttatus]|nr:hypothetical protein QTP86_008733 [Hemibagrus guttatus]